MLKKFQIIWNCKTYRKKRKYKDVGNDSKYYIVNDLFMELKMTNPNGCNIVINNLPLIFIFSLKNIEN